VRLGRRGGTLSGDLSPDSAREDDIWLM